jgi:hypothetical protein
VWQSTSSTHTREGGAAGRPRARGRSAQREKDFF